MTEISTKIDRNDMSPPLPIGFMIGKHPITEVLSTGGFSYVYLSRDKYDIAVAIKEYMPPKLSVRMRDMRVSPVDEARAEIFNYGMNSFYEEGRSLIKINHKNVVKVIDFIRENDTVYIVMKYEAGKTLSEYIRQQGKRLQEKAIIKFFLEVCDGLSEVHKQNIFHLDLKPANIYLRKDGSPILLDFGSVRHIEYNASKFIPLTLTHGFAAPEQYAGGSEIGPWTDIYSVGASMYGCIIGNGSRAMLPSGKDRLSGVEYKSAESIGKFKYSPKLLEIIDWCLEIDWNDRPRSAEELKREILKINPSSNSSGGIANLMNSFYQFLP